MVLGLTLLSRISTIVSMRAKKSQRPRDCSRYGRQEVAQFWAFVWWFWHPSLRHISQAVALVCSLPFYFVLNERILYYNTEMYTTFGEKKEFYFCFFCLQISLIIALVSMIRFSGIFHVNWHRVHGFPLRAQILANKYVIYFLRSFFSTCIFGFFFFLFPTILWNTVSF